MANYSDNIGTVVPQRLELIETQTLVAAATSVTFSGLNGDTDGVYQFVFRHIIAGAGAPAPVLRPNNLTTNQKYDSLYAVNGGAATGTTDNPWYMSTGHPAGTGGVLSISGVIHAKTGVIRSGRAFITGIDSAFTTALMINQISTWAWSDTSTNITSWVYVSDIASSIAAGSTFSLYRVRG